VVQGIIDRRVAALDDELTTFYAQAEVSVSADERLPFFTAQTQMTRDPDPHRREALGEGSAAVMQEARDVSLRLNAGVLDAIGSFGFNSYTDFWADLKQVDYNRLRAELARVAGESAEMYRRAVEPWMRASGHDFGSCPQWHVGYFRGMPQHDRLFRPSRLEQVMATTFRELGLDLFAEPVIHIDLEDRPSKNPRASVWVPEAGVEVHLLTRPTGGHHDYAAFLHEAGHALHFGLTDPAIGWPLANVGRSMAYAELWSFLLEHVGHQPGWIAAATGLRSDAAARVAADIAAVDLMMFIRYAAKFAYELELYAGDALDVERGRRLYSQTLSAGTGFVYDARCWQFDRDPGLYSADYLRAWLAQSALELKLRDMFGDRWWANREAGAWLRRQWQQGSLPEAEETIAAVGGTPWSGDALLSIFEERLAPLQAA
jgi:hypothetical protein